MKNATAVSQYGGDNNGARACSFDIGGVSVLVRSYDREKNAEVLALAGELADAAAVLVKTKADLAKAQAQMEALRGRIPPAKPSRLLGQGFVRFEGGRLWVLNRREKGFGEFGVYYAGWDEMFRALDVHVTGHGTDEHGAWWAVENRPEAR